MTSNDLWCYRSRPLALALLFASGLSARAEDASLEFTRDVQPILQKQCGRCHGADRDRAGLRLHTRDALLAGGDSGPVIVPGNSSASLLVQRVTSRDPKERMPAAGAPLTKEQIALLKKWIDQGAAGPAQGGDAKKLHWAFQPVRRPSIPATKATTWPRNPIDAFILARLEAAGLSPAPQAARATLIRRLKFDVLGLPPTPEEVDAFVTNPDSVAYEKLVERYLASPHFGERWARHWLDAVRFAESDGFETNQPRANAWPYRDYVIRALNEDKPYDRFILEQLAGDQFGADEATGFLVGGPCDKVKSPDVNLTLMQRGDELHDIINTTGATFLGLTVGCARCHNHKFDPISQVDYYALRAVFAGVQHGERPLQEKADRPGRARLVVELRRQLAEVDRALLAAEPLADPDTKQARRMSVSALRNVERFTPVRAKYLRFTILATNNLEPCIDELEVFSSGPEIRNVARDALATSSGDYPGSPLHRLEHINDGRYGNSRSWISNTTGTGWVQLELPRVETIERIEWARDREGKYADRLPVTYRIETATEPGHWRVIASSRDRAATGALPGDERVSRLLAERAEIQGQLRAAESAAMGYVGRFSAPEATYRLHRGDPMQKREAVAPAALAQYGARLILPMSAGDGARRLALAKWIADPRNRLTARVLVNRLWQHHFGAGIVNTPSDFGLNGGKPSHPELLDWLAAEFMAPGLRATPSWSMKHIHRLILLSATYRQASLANPRALTVDADARLLWRYPPRRLEAEPLRDAYLSVSGKLDLRMGGPGFDLFEPNTNYVKVYNPKKDFGPNEWRRMIYQSKWRMQLDDVFGAFDCPDAGQIAPKRNTSTTPLQALNLMNSRFMLQQARFFADRLEGEAKDDAARVRRGFRLAFQRTPSGAEEQAALHLVRDYGLPAFCRALFNANEFLFVD
jgi:hypothetical protein